MASEVKRECGNCTLCCKTMGVHDEAAGFHKPEGQWCTHCNPKKGCGIYANRPTPCQEFECLWLQGTLPVEWMPNKIHAVWYVTHDDGNKKQKFIVNIDPAYPEALDKLRPVIERTAEISPVVIVEAYGHRRLIYSGKDPEVWAEINGLVQIA